MMVTQNEELMVMRIEGLYNALQSSTERVASALQYRSSFSPKSKFPIVNFFRRMKEFSKEEKLYKLLVSLTTMKAVFDENMPFIVDGKLYFRFQPSKGSNGTRQIGEAKNPDDLAVYFNDFGERFSDTLAQSEIHQTIASPLFAHYCPALARTILSLPDSYQKSLGAAKEQSNH